MRFDDRLKYRKETKSNLCYGEKKITCHFSRNYNNPRLVKLSLILVPFFFRSSLIVSKKRRMAWPNFCRTQTVRVFLPNRELNSKVTLHVLLKLAAKMWPKLTTQLNMD